MKYKTIVAILLLCVLCTMLAPAVYAAPEDNYTIETWEIDYYRNLTLTVKSEHGEIEDAPFTKTGYNEFAISLLGPTVLTVPAGWTILSNPEYASGPEGVLNEAMTGISFGPGSEVTFADTPTFRYVNANPGSCTFMAWFNGNIAPPPTTSNFSLDLNGFIFERDNVELVRIQLVNEAAKPKMTKLYAPGEQVLFNITAATDLTDYSLKIYLTDTYKTSAMDVMPSISYPQDEQGTIISQRGSLSIKANGVYTLVAELTGPDYNQKATVNIGIIEKNETSQDDFIFGLQAIMMRPYYWGDQYAITGMSADDSYDIVFDYLLYSGANLVRDGAAYHDISFPLGNDFSRLAAFADHLAEHGISVNYGIGGTPNFAIDNTYLTGAPWQCPPKEEIFRSFMQDIAAELAPKSNIVWEVYNEPNSTGFWTGGRAKYMNILNIFSEELLAVNPNAVLSNGGMVVDPSHAGLDPEDDLFYYNENDVNNYYDMLNNGVITNVAIHGHGSLEGLHQSYHTVIPEIIPNESIYLNESGNMVKTDLMYQAKHLAGKLIYAKGNGFAGFVAYHLGAVNAEKNNMTPENNGGELVYDYGMVSDDLEPKPSYLSYMTAIKMLDGAEPIEIINESDDAFAYLFMREDNFIEVNIGEIRTPALEQSYVEYDMFGNEGGNACQIIYRIYQPAVESIPPVKIIYDGNGGTGSMASEEVAVGGSHEVKTPAFSHDGYTFTDWNTRKNGTGQSYQPGEIINNIDNDIYLHAQWKSSGSSSSSGGGSSGDNGSGSSVSSSGVSSSDSSSDNGGGSIPGSSGYSHRTLTDPNTGVSVVGYFVADAMLVVKERLLHPSGTCDVCDSIRKHDEAGKFIVLYDISISGNFQGEIEVKIPVGEEYNGHNLTVLHCANKMLDEKILSVRDGYVTGTFTGLSPFGVLHPLADPPVTNPVSEINPDDTSISVPQTDDSSNFPIWLLWFGSAILAIAVCIIILVWKR